jgi:hypothetical protein
MEPTAERPDDGSLDASLLSSGNADVCERSVADAAELGSMYVSRIE